MKLRELKRGTCIVSGENGHVLEFLGIDGVYARWKCGTEIIIMGHANQEVSAYGKILDNKKDSNGRTTK